MYAAQRDPRPINLKVNSRLFFNKMNLFIQRQIDHVNTLDAVNANLNVVIEFHWMLVEQWAHT